MKLILLTPFIFGGYEQRQAAGYCFSILDIRFTSLSYVLFFAAAHPDNTTKSEEFQR